MEDQSIAGSLVQKGDGDYSTGHGHATRAALGRKRSTIFLLF